jgi:hypothetical protein
MIPEVGMNPMAPRLVQLFARDGEGRINFRAFALGLCVFSERARADVKAASLHRVFDFDGDGYVSEADLRATLAMMCGSAPAAASRPSNKSTMGTQPSAAGGDALSFRQSVKVTAIVPVEEAAAEASSSSWIMQTDAAASECKERACFTATTRTPSRCCLTVSCVTTARLRICGIFL